MKRDWEKVLDQQLDLIKWIDSPRGDLWADWYINTAPGMSKVSGNAVGKASVKETIRMMNTADTVFVTRDMCDLIEHAANELPPTTLEPHMLFWQNAFIMYERPISMSWDIPDEPDNINVTGIHSMVGPVMDADHWEATGDRVFKDGVIHVTYVDADQFGLDYEEIDLGTRHFPFDLSAWTFHKNWKIVKGADRPYGGTNVDEGLARQRRLLLATHLISAQKLAMVSGHTPSRALAHRTASVMPEYGEIRVVRLRRTYTPSFDHDPENLDVEWSHRWVVRGHWRQQYYPSRDEHDLVWIAPYVKGPEDKPLVVKDNVFSVER